MLLNQYLPLFISTWLLFFSNICVASKRFDGESLAYFTLIPVWKDQESKLWQLVCLPVCLCCSPPYWLMLPVQVAPVILTYCCSDWRLFFSLPPSDAHDAKCWNVSPSSLFTQARWRVNTLLTLYFSELWKKKFWSYDLVFIKKAAHKRNLSGSPAGVLNSRQELQPWVTVSCWHQTPEMKGLSGTRCCLMGTKYTSQVLLQNHKTQIDPVVAPYSCLHTTPLLPWLNIVYVINSTTSSTLSTVFSLCMTYNILLILYILDYRWFTFSYFYACLTWTLELELL